AEDGVDRVGQRAAVDLRQLTSAGPEAPGAGVGPHDPGAGREVVDRRGGTLHGREQHGGAVGPGGGRHRRQTALTGAHPGPENNRPAASATAPGRWVGWDNARLVRRTARVVDAVGASPTPGPTGPR